MHLLGELGDEGYQVVARRAALAGALLCGGRADPQMVREGSTEARVEGRFEDPLTSEEVVVARVVPATGRSRRQLQERADALLAGFGLEGLAGRMPDEVSIGEQQRTAMARALLLSPKLLLADEPTGHQDEGWGRVVFRALRLAAREGTACLVATHNLEAIPFTDRVLGIRDGQVRPVQRGEVAGA